METKEGAKRIAINTPNGKTGRALTERLIGKDVDLILLTRHPDRLRQYERRGAAVLDGTLDDADVAVRATRGADALFRVTPADSTAADIRAYYNEPGTIGGGAVAANTIPRVANISSIGAQLESGTGPIAAVAAERILDTKWTGRSVIELTGPAEMTFDSAAGILGSAPGMEVRHVQVSLQRMRDALLRTRVSRGVADSDLETYEAVAAGTIRPEPPTSLQRTSMRFDDFAKNVFRPGLEAMGGPGQ